VVDACAEDAKPQAAALSGAPVHRYSFNGKGGIGAALTDSTGNVHGQICAETPPKPLPYHEGSTTMVVIPDTEGYCRKRPHIFNAMMKWVADNKDKRNIACVLHVGDITNDNAKDEWKNARKAFDIIEGKVPYVLAAGNHDYDGTPGRLTYMNEFFKVADLKKRPGFGDVYEPGKLENHYQFMKINGQKWIVLSLEMGPRKEVIAWANKVLEKHKDRLAIVLTHGYLYYGNVRYNHLRGGQRASPYKFYGDGADGEMMWNQLVRKHANVMMVICGHLSSQYVGYRKDKGDGGNIVHQMLVDYEKMRGGGGFLRVLEFLPDGKTVQVRTYSPVTKEIRSPITRGDKPQRDPKLEEFTFTLQAAGGNERLLTTGARGGPVKKKKTTTDRDNSAVAGSEDKIRLNGKGQLVIDANDGRAYGKLDASLVKGRKEVSFEVWFTPTAESYNWSPVVQFRGGKDAFYYTFRTLNRHRAELIVNGHNEDIQRKISVKVGRPMHVVVTYDQDGQDGRPVLSSYVNGKLTGRMVTKIKLSELGLTSGRIGPFAGKFDELRIYDYPLNARQVQGNYAAGPNRVNLAKVTFHCTDGYPERWRGVYRETLEHFSAKYGRVGPLHVFLIENADWKLPEGVAKKDAQKLAKSQKELRRLFCKLQGDDSTGERLDWTTGKHWAGWSIKPPKLTITMTMSPYRDGEQFVIGPIHEYMHAYQTAHGYEKEAVHGNKMGQSLWTGPAWWREGSAVLVAGLYCCRHPELYKKLKKPYPWEAFSREMNRNLKMYRKAGTNIRKGVTHDDWGRLEKSKLVHPVIYAGGSAACALLLQKAGSLRRFMEFFPLVPELGWKDAFEKHFEITLEEFYKEFDKFARAAGDKLEAESPTGSWCDFLKSIE
jgi:predicted phosphodiesterase